MAGCPNRCKHCWLGITQNGRLHLDDLEFAAESFRSYANALEVCSWYREPDYLDHYMELYDAESRLSTVFAGKRHCSQIPNLHSPKECP
jgi:hypothetical protein